MARPPPPSPATAVRGMPARAAAAASRSPSISQSPSLVPTRIRVSMAGSYAGAAQEASRRASYVGILPRHDDRGVVRHADRRAPGTESLPDLGGLQALRRRRPDPRAGLGPHRPAIPSDRLVSADLQRHSHALRRLRGA